jgi:hypothetical protein
MNREPCAEPPIAVGRTQITTPVCPERPSSPSECPWSIPLNSPPLEGTPASPGPLLRTASAAPETRRNIDIECQFVP